MSNTIVATYYYWNPTFIKKIKKKCPSVAPSKPTTTLVLLTHSAMIMYIELQCFELVKWTIKLVTKLAKRTREKEARIRERIENECTNCFT
jgi:hypothetical protein